MSDIDLLADAREWLATQGDRVQTHSEACHRWHPACLVARLVREVERLRLTDAEYLALAQARDAYAANSDDEECVEIAVAIRSLLERNSTDRIGKPTKTVESQT
jgi:hypothetical protein